MSNLIEIKDITGLKEPLLKLIEVVSKGIGDFTEPYLMKKRADAKAYELIVINKALRDSNANGEIVYDGEKVSFETSLIDGDIKERALNKTLYQQVKKQKNIENIIEVAQQDLEEADTVSSDKVNEDWITRFFDISENVSDEDMQILWGKILAGEIMKPNTYSLRTLEALRNMSKIEAEVFAKVARFAIKGSVVTFILADKQVLEQYLDIKFSETLLLQELNLISNQELSFTIGTSHKGIGISQFILGDKIVSVEKEEGVPAQNFQVYAFTKIGEELLNLAKTEFHEDYMKSFASKLKTDRVKVKYSQIIRINGSSVEHLTQCVEL